MAAPLLVLLLASSSLASWGAPDSSKTVYQEADVQNAVKKNRYDAETADDGYQNSEKTSTKTSYASRMNIGYGQIEEVMKEMMKMMIKNGYGMPTSGYTPVKKKMASGGYGKQEITSGGYGKPKMTSGGYGKPKMTSGGYSKPKMSSGGYGKPKMSSGGYGKSEMTSGGYGKAEVAPAKDYGKTETAPAEYVEEETESDSGYGAEEEEVKDGYSCKQGSIREDPAYYDAYQVCVYGDYITMPCAPGTSYCGYPICGTCNKGYGESGKTSPSKDKSQSTGYDTKSSGKGKSGSKKITYDMPTKDMYSSGYSKNMQTSDSYSTSGGSSGGYEDMDPVVMMTAMSKAVRSGRFSKAQTNKMKQMLAQMMVVMMIMGYGSQDNDYMMDTVSYMDENAMMDLVRGYGESFGEHIKDMMDSEGGYGSETKTGYEEEVSGGYETSDSSYGKPVESEYEKATRTSYGSSMTKGYMEPEPASNGYGKTIDTGFEKYIPMKTGSEKPVAIHVGYGKSVTKSSDKNTGYGSSTKDAPTKNKPGVIIKISLDKGDQGSSRSKSSSGH